jgi:hypothetical protein
MTFAALSGIWTVFYYSPRTADFHKVSSTREGPGHVNVLDVLLKVNEATLLGDCTSQGSSGTHWVRLQ